MRKLRSEKLRADFSFPIISNMTVQPSSLTLSQSCIASMHHMSFTLALIDLTLECLSDLFSRVLFSFLPALLAAPLPAPEKYVGGINFTSISVSTVFKQAHPLKPSLAQTVIFSYFQGPTQVGNFVIFLYFFRISGLAQRTLPY